MACRRLDAVTLSDPRVEKALSGFERVRIELDEHPDARERFRLQAIPTLVVLAADGRELARWVGYLDPEALLERLDALERKIEPKAA